MSHTLENYQFDKNHKLFAQYQQQWIWKWINSFWTFFCKNNKFDWDKPQMVAWFALCTFLGLIIGLSDIEIIEETNPQELYFLNQDIKESLLCCAKFQLVLMPEFSQTWLLHCEGCRLADWRKISYFLPPITECVKWRWIQSATIMCCIYDSCFKRCYVKWNDPWLICIQVTQWSRSRDHFMGGTWNWWQTARLKMKM